MSAKQSKDFSPVAGGLIDGPSPFEPLETWIAFREELREMPKSDDRDFVLVWANRVIWKKLAAEKT